MVKGFYKNIQIRNVKLRLINRIKKIDKPNFRQVHCVTRTETDTQTCERKRKR